MSAMTVRDAILDLIDDDDDGNGWSLRQSTSYGEIIEGMGMALFALKAEHGPDPAPMIARSNARQTEAMRAD